jgi:hypothetical protein
MADGSSIALEDLGFRFKRSGGHSARTIMFEELNIIFTNVQDENASKQTYLDAIVLDNCLGKPSKSSQMITAQIISTMYGFDSSIPLFRLLRYFWSRDLEGRPLLAGLCAYARDPIFRMSAPYILQIEKGTYPLRSNLEEFIEKQEPGRYSPITRASVAKNINSSWTQIGHLAGKMNKIRSEAKPTVGSTAYAIIIAILLGNRGRSLFDSEPVRILDVPTGRIMELAKQASEKGWLTYKSIGEIIEIQIPSHFGIRNSRGY